MPEKWTGGYEGSDGEGERPEGDAPTSVRYTVVLTPGLGGTVTARILREGETCGTFRAETEEEAQWIASRIAGTYTLPTRYD